MEETVVVLMDEVDMDQKNQPGKAFVVLDRSEAAAFVQWGLPATIRLLLHGLLTCTAEQSFFSKVKLKRRRNCLTLRSRGLVLRLLSRHFSNR